MLVFSSESPPPDKLTSDTRLCTTSPNPKLSSPSTSGSSKLRRSARSGGGQPSSGIPNKVVAFVRANSCNPFMSISLAKVSEGFRERALWYSSKARSVSPIKWYVNPRAVYVPSLFGHNLIACS